MENIKTRGMEASVKYLERKGYELLDTDNEEQMVVVFNEEEDALVFAHVTVSAGDDFSESISRTEFEQYAIKQLPHFTDKYTNKEVRFDEIALKILGSDKALLRHHHNCIEW